MTTRRAIAFAAFAGALVCPAGGLSAQDTSGPRAAIDRLFDGMRAHDASMMASVFAEGARLQARTRDEPIQIRSIPAERFVESVAAAEGELDEQIYDVRILVDEDMASAWAPYTFYRNGEISHCGINSFELMRDAEGWKITQVTDTRRTEGCPDPHGVG